MNNIKWRDVVRQTCTKSVAFFNKCVDHAKRLCIYVDNRFNVIENWLPQLKWLYKLYIARWLFRDKGFLSNIVKSELKKYKKPLETKTHIGDVLSSKIGCVLAFGVPFMALYLIMTAVLSIPPLDKLLYEHFDFLSSTNQDGRNPLITALNTTAGVVAGFTGILVALVTFGINVNSLYLQSNESLFQLIIKRGGYIFIAVLSVGSIAMSLAVAMIGMQLSAKMFLNMSFSSLLLSIIVLLLEIYLLSYTIKSLGRKACRELLTGNFKENHRKSLLAEIERRITVNIFKQRLEEIGIEWNTYAEPYEKGKTKYFLKKTGLYLSDVYWPSLEGISNHWKLEKLDNSDDTACSIYGDNRTSSAIIPLLPHSKNGNVALLGMEDNTSQVQSLINRSFILTSNRKLKMPESKWDEISKMLKAQIRDSNDSGFKELLDIVKDIINDYFENLKNLKITHERYDIFSHLYTDYRPPSLSNMKFYDIMDIASDKDDCKSVKLILVFLNDIGYDSMQGGLFEYYDEVFSYVNVLYKYSSLKEKLSGLMKRELVSTLNYLAPIILRSGSTISLEDINAAVKGVILYLKNFCNIAINVAKNGDVETFENIFEGLGRLDDNQSYSLRSHFYSLQFVNEQQDADNKKEIIEKKLDIHILICLTKVVISAWIVELYKHDKLTSQSNTRFIEAAMKKIGEIEDWVEIFLLAKKGRYQCDLGYEHWSHIDMIPGKSYTTHGTCFDRWIKPFILSYMLKFLSNKKGSNRLLDRIRPVEPFRDDDYKYIEASINKVIGDENYYGWFAEKEELEKGKDSLLEIFAGLKERQKCKDNDKLLLAPLSNTKISAFKNGCIKGYTAERKLYHLLKRMDIPLINKSDNKSDHAVIKQLFEKTWFIDGWYTGFGGSEFWGDELAQMEDANSFRFIHENLERYDKVTNFSFIPSVIKESVLKMKREGFRPNLILIPEDHRFQSIFTSKSNWQRESEYKNNKFPQWVASFEDMQVFVWSNPYCNSIAIIDVGKFLGINIDDENKNVIDFELAPISEDDVHSYLEKEEGKTDDKKFWHDALKEYNGNIDVVSKIYLNGKIETQTRLCIIDSRAGVRLEWDKEKIGVVCDMANKICHSGDCKLVSQIPEEQKAYSPTASYAWRIEGYDSCDKCSPLFGSYL